MKHPFERFAAESTRHGPPVQTGDLAALPDVIGREIPEELARLWSLINGGWLRDHRLYDVKEVIAALDVFTDWKSPGWIPIGSDAFGNQFVSIPTPIGEVVGFVDVGFDSLETVLCVAGSSIERFVAQLLFLDTGECDPNMDPCAMAAADPGLTEAEAAIAKHLKYG